MNSIRHVVLLLLMPIALMAAPPDTGNALSIFNAFIARYANERIDWRADVKMYRAGQPVAPGFQLGKSPLGEFTYRPKLFTELNQEQKRAVVADERMAAFIMNLRMAADPLPSDTAPIAVEELGATETAKIAVKAIVEALPVGARRPQDVLKVVEISAEQILGDGPVRIFIP